MESEVIGMLYFYVKFKDWNIVYLCLKTLHWKIVVNTANGHTDCSMVPIFPFNPRPAGVFSRTRPAALGGADSAPPLPNSRTNRRSEAGEAAIESPEREDSNAH